MSEVWTEMEIHVGERAGEYVTVRPWPDAPSCVEICTDECEEFYGEQSITMSPQMARALSVALMRVAAAIEEHPDE